MTDEQKEKKPGKPIGSIENFSTFGKKHSEAQTSRSLDAESASSSNVQKSSIFDSRKSKHPHWKQKTVYLPADLAKWLNVFAAQSEMEVSEIVAQALWEFQEKYK